MLSFFGCGKVTKAIAKTYKNYAIFDDTFIGKTIDENNNIFANPSFFDENISTLEIVSPGIPPSHILIQKAKNIISEYDLYADKMPQNIWISGTNGKTTTTEMTQLLLSSHNAICGGNIGIPLVEMDFSAKLWILETSSFVMHYTKKAFPNLYILLPIKQDHIAWHGNFENYIQDKLSPLLRMDSDGIVILPEVYKDTKTKAKIISYKNTKDLASKMEIDLNKISYKEPFLLDATLSLSISKLLFNELNYALLDKFKIGDHRLKEFSDSKKRLWVNDSKATNAHAVSSGISGYRDKKIHLILGGDDKGAELKSMFIDFKTYNIKLYFIGSNQDKLSALASKYEILFMPCDDIKKAVFEIDKALQNDEVAILSPAAASFDQFNNYKHRGEVFVNLVSEL